jgi:hypothetical protein
MNELIKPVLLGMACLCVTGMPLAMGTPPQTAAKTAPDSDANAVMIKADDLRAAPDATAKVLARVDKGERVRLLTSQGGWSQVAGAGKTGWVRVLSVSGTARDGIGLADIGALGKTPQGKVVAVAGTRGLDQAQLGQAAYNAREIETLHGYAVSREAARQFAQQADLRARAMPYVAAPEQ